jgi:glycosyltransferase involved in cell wall biosynthesis
VTIQTGCPPVAHEREFPPVRKTLFLCVGHLSLRKGTPYLIESWRRLQVSPEVAELRLVGSAALPPSMLNDLPPGVQLEGQLSRSALHELYRKASVFVLPTLCEGLAHVIPEALSYGLPIIATANSGAEGLVEVA